MKLLYIDACIRGADSRTRRIAAPLIEALSRRYEIDRIDLNLLTLVPLQKPSIAARFRGEVDADALSWATRVRDADRIVIAAPFWDMSIPAALKVFFERCSLLDVTFANGKDACVGLCRAEKLLFVTTRGMDISTGEPLEQATTYLRAISHLWGIGELFTVAAQNMDYVDEDTVEEKIQCAIAEGYAVAETF